MIDISVIIVSWNAKDYLINCLESLKTQAATRQMEVFVIDNASGDSSAQVVKERYPYVKIIQNKTNLGFAKANNIGIDLSKGDYICLINSDVVVLDKCLDVMIDYMNSHPNIGMLGPKVFNPDLTIQYSCRYFPTLWKYICFAVGLSNLFPQIKYFCDDKVCNSEYNEIKKVDVLSGCFQMIRRSALSEVGNLDERFFIYFEDVDWCKRLKSAGWDVTFYPYAEVIHHSAASSDNDPIAFDKEQEKSLLQYWKKYHGMVSVKCLKCILILKHLIRIVAAGTLSYVQPRLRKRHDCTVSRHIECLRWLISARM